MDVLLKATKVDGVYTEDPMINPDATRFDSLTYSEALAGRYGVMDAAAFSLCMENKIPIIIFNFFESDSIEKIVVGEGKGTLISSE